MTPALTLETSRSDATAQIRAAGEIDVSCVDELRQAVLSAADDAERVLLDLSPVEFIDTTAWPR